MLKQHQVDKFYGAFVYGVHATRVSIAQSPLLGYAVLAGISVTVLPIVQPYVQPIVQGIASSEVAVQAEQSIRASLNAVEAGLRSMAPEPEHDISGLGLSREQLRVATYVSKKYQVALGEVQQYVSLAFEKAAQQRVDPMLVLAVMAIESNFKSSAQSHVGAQGLMQVHLVAHKDKFEPFGGKHMAYDPATNIQVGIQILKEYLRRTSSNEMALKYYVGAAHHENDGGYAYKVLSERERILAAASGRSVPAVPLKAPDWLLAKWQPPAKASEASTSNKPVEAALGAEESSSSGPGASAFSKGVSIRELTPAVEAPAVPSAPLAPISPSAPMLEDKLHKESNVSADTMKVSFTEK
jgi:Transglycosylase SLT domain